MAIQIPNPGIGNGATGDNEFVLWSKVKSNFEDQTNAASRLVGTASGNVMEVGAFGLGKAALVGLQDKLGLADLDTSTGFYRTSLSTGAPVNGWVNMLIVRDRSDLAGDNASGERSSKIFIWGRDDNPAKGSDVYIGGTSYGGESLPWAKIHTTSNTTKDSNGFLKGASPVVDLYNDGITLNDDAKNQGGITFEKLGIGDYLVKGSLGFAQEGWYIETPKDANGNVLVAVIYEQLANNDISIKTYAKKFDDETGDIVANLLKPRDIPTGRFISLRLHELPKEPPVMPTETQPEV